MDEQWAHHTSLTLIHGTIIPLPLSSSPLQILDGKGITKSERILAAQKYAGIREHLVRERQERALLAGGADAMAAMVDEPPVLLTPEEYGERVAWLGLLAVGRDNLVRLI